MKKKAFVLVVVFVCCWQAQAQLCTDFTSTMPDITTFIDDVSTTGGVANISNLGSDLDSGNSAIRYVNNFSTMAVSTYSGGSFDFNVATDSSVGCVIWVDWNGNDTLELSEVVFHTTSYGDGPFTGTILTPGGTADGDYVMRIMIDWEDPNPDDDPCAFETDLGRGEVEDYKVTVDASLAPACLAPTMLSASNIGDTTADLGWTENGTATVWDIELVDITASATATGTPTATSVSNPYTATGLGSANGYEFYVRADCGTTDGVSTWAGPFAFSTLCNATTPPFSENFDASTSLGCGTIVNDGSGNVWEINTSTSYGFTANHLRYEWNSSSNAANTWYFTQGLNLTGGASYTLAYDYGGGLSFFTESLRVSYGTAANSGAMTTELANYPSITNSTLTSDSVVFTPPADGVYYIGFQAYSAANQDVLHLDSIAVDFTLSTPDLANSVAFTYYPNPVGNTLSLKAQNTIESITVYNMLGQDVLRAQPNSVDSTLDMSGLANGAYFVKVTIANSTKTIRIIKQ